MLVKHKRERKCVRGKGFVDVLKNVGSYAVENKDLIAKPLLGAAGDLAAYGLTEGGKALLKRMIAKKTELDPKSKEILKRLAEPKVTNEVIIGSGIKRF